jgi:hypothetical protein
MHTIQPPSDGPVRAAKPDPASIVGKACRKLSVITLLNKEYLTEGRSISTIFHSLARLYYDDQLLVDFLIRMAVVPVILQSFNQTSISTLLWSVARIQYHPEPHVMQALLERLLEPKIMNEMNSHMLSNVVWAMGALRHHHPRLMITCCQRLMNPSVFHSANPLVCAHFLWGCATLNWEDRVVLVTVGRRLVKDGWIPFMKSYELSLILWALGRFRVLEVDDLGCHLP